MDEKRPSSRHTSIETLRALAVALVFVHHVHTGANITLPYFAELGGWLGVQVFFVISGYLIILSAQRYALGTYVMHRLARIYPAYVVWFLVFSVLLGQLTWERLDVRALLVHLAFLQHLFPSAYIQYNALFVSWTLTIEMVWYVVAFAGLVHFRRRPVMITVASMALSYAWTFLGMSHLVFPELVDMKARFFFANNHVVNQLPFFFFGALIAVLEPRWDKAGLFGVFLVTVVLSSAWKAHFPDPIFITGMGVAALFLLLKDLDYRNPRPVVFLSDVSYSFYLIHYPVIVMVNQATPNKALVLAGSVVVTLVLSWLSYRLIEQPFIKLARRKTALPQSAAT